MTFHTFRPCSRRFYAGTPLPRSVRPCHQASRTPIQLHSRCRAPGDAERCIQRLFHSCRIDNHTERVVRTIMCIILRWVTRPMVRRGMLHDPNVFAEPHRFYPERWFSPSAPAFPNQAFGFGARLCPGRFFARRSIWANMVGILAAFKITPTEDGPPRLAFSSGLISYVV
jgi:hypothetical protein